MKYLSPFTITKILGSSRRAEGNAKDNWGDHVSARAKNIIVKFLGMLLRMYCETVSVCVLGRLCAGATMTVVVEV